MKNESDALKTTDTVGLAQPEVADFSFFLFFYGGLSEELWLYKFFHDGCFVPRCFTSHH